MTEKDQPNSAKQPQGSSRTPSVSGLLPGLILLLLGILFLLNQLGALSKDDAWQYFIVGLGVIFLIEAWVRDINPASGRPRAGRIIAGFILIVIGLVFLFSSTPWWPMALIIAGLALLLNFVIKRPKISRR